MPYPLAHPAAVLPLRRFCPRYLSLPALVIGSLTPDLGYCFGNSRVDWFSHRFLAGSFCFSLPVGLLLMWAGRTCAARLAGNAGHETVEPAAKKKLFAIFRGFFWPPGFSRPNLLGVVCSLLLGAWTHVVLDSITHGDGWLVEHVGFLHAAIALTPAWSVRVYDLIYAGCTFGGVAWVAWVWLRWLENMAWARRRSAKARWGWSLLLAGIILMVAIASRGEHRWIGTFPAALVAVVVVAGWVALSVKGEGWRDHRCRESGAHVSESNQAGCSSRPERKEENAGENP